MPLHHLNECCEMTEAFSARMQYNTLRKTNISTSPCVKHTDPVAFKKQLLRLAAEARNAPAQRTSTRARRGKAPARRRRRRVRKPWVRVQRKPASEAIASRARHLASASDTSQVTGARMLIAQVNLMSFQAHSLILMYSD